MADLSYIPTIDKEYIKTNGTLIQHTKNISGTPFEAPFHVVHHKNGLPKGAAHGRFGDFVYANGYITDGKHGDGLTYVKGVPAVDVHDRKVWNEGRLHTGEFEAHPGVPGVIDCFEGVPYYSRQWQKYIRLNPAYGAAGSDANTPAVVVAHECWVAHAWGTDSKGRPAKRSLWPVWGIVYKGFRRENATPSTHPFPAAFKDGATNGEVPNVVQYLLADGTTGEKRIRLRQDNGRHFTGTFELAFEDGKLVAAKMIPLAATAASSSKGKAKRDY